MALQERLLLYKLARELKPGSVIVEIGSYLGASSTFLAAGAKESRGLVYCVDTWENDAMSEGQRDTYEEFMKNTQRFKTVIAPLRGLSTDIARSFNKRIDLLFIDGDHSYEGVKEDVEAWFPKLNEKAVVIFHDIGWAEGVQKVVTECVRPSADKEIFLPNLYASFISERNES
jgi:predicted O-methyltransferase YrrM